MSDTVARILERVVREPCRTPGVAGQCWVWSGAANRNGYGVVKIAQRVHYVHHVTYVAHRGEIPAGLELLTACKEPGCANPWHWEPGTRSQALQGRGKGTRTHCGRGHERASVGTYKNGACRACSHENAQGTRQRRKARAAAAAAEIHACVQAARAPDAASLADLAAPERELRAPVRV